MIKLEWVHYYFLSFSSNYIDSVLFSLIQFFFLWFSSIFFDSVFFPWLSSIFFDSVLCLRKKKIKLNQRKLNWIKDNRTELKKIELNQCKQNWIKENNNRLILIWSKQFQFNESNSIILLMECPPIRGLIQFLGKPFYFCESYSIFDELL